MNVTRKLVLLCLSLMFCTFLNAQIEVAHLKSKDFSSTGFGAFLNFSIPVSEGNAVTAEAGFYNFKSKDDDHIALVPFLLGFRYTLDGTGTGFYVEPHAGYTIGGSDIQKYNEVGTPIYDENGSPVEQKVKGVNAGISGGYIIPGSFSLNIALRYQHVFVSKDPTLNIFALRLSYPFSFGRRDD